MKVISLIKHSKGALGLRFFGLGPNLKPTNGLNKLQKLLDRNTFWAKNRKINDLKKLISEKRVMYDHNVDMRSYKWSGKSILKKIDLDQLPKFISSIIDNYKEWLD